MAFVSAHETVVAKAISFGSLTHPGDQIAHTNKVSSSSDFSGLASCPVLLQVGIPKKHDWRITTVGDRIFAARTRRDICVDPYDWRRSANVNEIFEPSRLPANVSEMILSLCRRSDLRFGAHDLIEAPDGEFYFLETNPAGQWGWLEVALGLPIGETLAALLMAHGGA